MKGKQNRQHAMELIYATEENEFHVCHYCSSCTAIVANIECQYCSARTSSAVSWLSRVIVLRHTNRRNTHEWMWQQPQHRAIFMKSKGAVNACSYGSWQYTQPICRAVYTSVRDCGGAANIWDDEWQLWRLWNRKYQNLRPRSLAKWALTYYGGSTHESLLRETSRSYRC